MRPPLRAVVDDHVDRPQVGAWRHVEPSGTNGPSAWPGGGRPAGALRRWSAEAAMPDTDVPAFLPRPCRKACKWRSCAGAHLFPSRTEKLSPAAAMILRSAWESSPPPTPNANPDNFCCRGSVFLSRSFPLRIIEFTIFARFYKENSIIL